MVAKRHRGKIDLMRIVPEDSTQEDRDLDDALSKEKSDGGAGIAQNAVVQNISEGSIRDSTQGTELQAPAVKTPSLRRRRHEVADVRLHALITHSQKEYLESLAKEMDTSVGEIVRYMIELFRNSPPFK